MDGEHIPAPTAIGLLGLGYWGPTLARTLFELLSPLDHVIAYDPHPGRLAAAQERFPALRRADSEDALFAERPAAVFIAAPSSEHARLAARALRAGAHTYIETPMATSSAEAAQLLALARAAGVQLTTGRVLDFTGPADEIDRRIRAGSLGRLLRFTGQHIGGRPRPDVSVLWDLGPHLLGLITRWTGELPETVAATCTPDADSAFVQLAYADGLIGGLELAWRSPTPARRCSISGTDSILAFDALQHLQPVREIAYTGRGRSFAGEVRIPDLTPPPPLRALLQRFLAAARGLQPVDNDPAETAVDVVRVIEAAERSAERREMVHLR